MPISTLAAWHAFIESDDLKKLEALLADDAVFYSPIVHTPQTGKAMTLKYLTAATHVLGSHASFHYVREIAQGNDAVLEFNAEIDGIHIDGIDMFRWNDAGLITEFKVFVRPLKAINLLHQKMAAMLAQAR